MAFVDVRRITSGTDTQVDATSRQNAIQKAIHKAAELPGTQDAVVIGNQPGGIWPELTTYNNDTSGGENTGDNPFNEAQPPQFIWDDTTFEPGETRYFAVALPVVFTDELLVNVTTFADNAHRLFVEEREPDGFLLRSFTPNDGLFDGPMTANASLNVDKENPFNWQKIRIWSKGDIIPDSDDNYLVFSWEVLNYDTTDTVNPPGLAFQIDIYRNEPDNGP
ncbi:MAG TPA: hypothetical protein GX505_13165 [Clostridiales bacterium]|nr:hypothetical protein [Clostridiales bacterium]